MHPIIVRPTPSAAKEQATGRGDGSGPGGNGYELVAGERRWRAARIAGLKQLPAIVRELDDQQIAEWSLIENLQREDLNPIERAEAFNHLSDRFQLSHEQIAARIGLDRSTVSNLLRLLDLSEKVKRLVRDNLLSMGQARAVAGLSDADQQGWLSERAIREGLSVRDVEAAARRLMQGAPASAPSSKHRSPESSGAGRPRHLKDIEQQIGQQLGTKVTIRPGRKKGAGRLTIHFYSLNQFDDLLSRLGVETD